MLSTKAIGSATQASHYFFNRDDYYSKEGELYERPSEWYGKGAESLGLKGTVDKKEFFELLAGKLPNGEQIGLMKNGTIKHRSGFDLTFSAPKSWSLANYETKDPIFDKIFEQSVKYTLDLIERDCAMANIYKNKEQHMEKTGNIIASLHFHRLSRELEPNDHIHSVIKNATQRNDGSWRALKSDDPKKMQHQYSEGFFERTNTRKKDYGAIQRMYQAYLAVNAGFAIERTGDTFWELKHVTKEKITEFSTRREQILSDMELTGSSGGKAAAVSNLRTRVAKSNLSRDEIATGINARLAKFQDKITIESLKQNSINKIDDLSNEQEQAKIAVAYAINHLSEIAPSFSTTKLLACAMQHSFAKASITSLLAAIDKAKEIGVINILEKTNGDIAYVSNKNIDIEKRILVNFTESLNSDRGIVKSDNKFNKWQKKYVPDLNKEQKDALAGVLRSNDRVNAIDGYDNSDKSKLIAILSKMASKSWYNPIVLTVSKNEAQDLCDAKNIHAKTVASYLKSIEIKENKNHGKINQDGEVLIIDGSHRLNTKQHAELIRIAADNKARIIHLYDSRQPENFQPGNAMQLLKNAGMNIAKLTTKVKSIMPNDVAIKAEPDDRLRHQDIVTDYLEYKLNASNQKIQIVTQSKNSANKINVIVQQELKAKNLLGKDFNTITYNQRFLTTAQTKLAGQYRVGDLVAFSKDYVSLDVKKDLYYKIATIDKPNNVISLESGDKIIKWDPNKVAGGREGVVKTYEISKMQLYEHDKVFLQQDFKEHKLFKGQDIKIGKVTDDKIELITSSGKQHRLKRDSNILAHLNLSYAKTAAQSYSDKPDVILAEQLAFRRQTNVKQFYKVVAQAKDRIKIYTDNKASYLETLKKHSGDTKPIVEMILSKVNNSVANVTREPISDIDAAISRLSTISVSDKSLSSKYHKTLTSQKINTKNFTYTLLKDCIDSISEQEAVFTRHNLESKMAESASKFNHVIDISRLDIAIEKALNKNKLYQTSLHGDLAYTTPRAVKLETKVLTLAKNTINNAYKFSNINEVKPYLTAWQQNNTKLSASQKSAVEKITTTDNGLILVNGLAGVGKTTMLSAIKPLADNKGIKMIGLAPTNAATNELKERGIESCTLDSYLAQLVKSHRDKTINRDQKTLVILDESSMASTEKLSNLLLLTKNTNTRLAFVGDVAQLPAIEQGKMFWFLQKIGIETTHVKDIIRQKNSPEYLDLVKKTYAGDFKAVLSTMKKNGLAYDHKSIKESNPELNLDNKDELVFARINFMIDKLLQRTQADRNSTRIVTPANNERNLFNVLYRKELQRIGELSQKEFNTKILVNSNLSKHKRSEAINYNVDQVIKFNSNITDTNISKNDYLSITDIDYKNNHLILKNDKNSEFVLRLNQFKGDNAWKVTIFNQEDRNIATGDTIRWRITDKTKSRINMAEAKVIDANGGFVTVEDQNGNTQEIHFNNRADQHWDHAYAGTAYTEQGKTAIYVWILMDSGQVKLASKPTFLVALTRATDYGLIVTDDIDRFVKRLEITSGIKTSALESLGYKDRHKVKIKDNKQSITVNDKNIHIKAASKIENNNPKTINKYNASELAAALSLDAENVAINILGKPLKKSGVNLYFGSNKGSLAVTISGKYQGTFKDFDTGDKGNLLTLIQQKLQLNFKETLEYAAKLINHTYSMDIDNNHTVSIRHNKTKNNEINEHQQKRIHYAQMLANEAINIKGTLAEKYLVNTRGINLTKWPVDVKFHPGIYNKLNNSSNPALLIIARNKDNKVQAVQAIYLDPKNAEKAEVDIKKQTFGVLKGSLFYASNNSNDKSTAIICEGPEDALSIAKSDNSTAVFACLGKLNFINIPLSQMTGFNNIILALDNDGKNINDMPNIINAANNIQSVSNHVWLTQPNKIKEDYNDLLKSSKCGHTLVNNVINNAINLKDLSNDFKEKITFGDRFLKNINTEINANTSYKISVNTDNKTSNIMNKTKEIDLQI